MCSNAAINADCVSVSEAGNFIRLMNRESIKVGDHLTTPFSSSLVVSSLDSRHFNFSQNYFSLSDR